jgi:hypothetical protein
MWLLRKWRISVVGYEFGRPSTCSVYKTFQAGFVKRCLMISRRIAIIASFAAVVELMVSQSFADTDDQNVETRLKELEERSGGRLGVAVLERRAVSVNLTIPLASIL